MKNTIKQIRILPLVLFSLFFIASSKKVPGQVTPPTPSGNKPAIAKAGADQTIQMLIFKLIKQKL